jgi:hypothetical protein
MGDNPSWPHSSFKNDALAEAMYEEYLTGKSLKEVGEIFNRSYKVVWKAFSRRGYKLRRTGVRSGLNNYITFDNEKYSLLTDGYYHRTSDGYPLHKAIWEYNYGKIEDPDMYVVHHIDHNKLNNDISNLQLMTRREHSAHHAKEKK